MTGVCTRLAQCVVVYESVSCNIGLCNIGLCNIGFQLTAVLVERAKEGKAGHNSVESVTECLAGINH